MVQFIERRHSARRSALVLVPAFQAIQLFVEEWANMEEEGAHAPLPDLEHDTLGAVDNVVYGIELRIGKALYLRARIQEPSQDRLFLDEARIVLDVRCGRGRIHQ